MAIETVLRFVVWQLCNGGVKVLIRGASCHKGLEMERWRMGRREGGKEEEGKKVQGRERGREEEERKGRRERGEKEQLHKSSKSIYRLIYEPQKISTSEFQSHITGYIHNVP